MSQTCAPSAAGSTNLVVGRYSDNPDYASSFPIARLQLWNRALSAAEASLSTTSDPAPSTVTFNGAVATPTNWSPTSITVPVPPGATTGPIVVTVGGQASNAVPFAVSPSITDLLANVGRGRFDGDHQRLEPRGDAGYEHGDVQWNSRDADQLEPDEHPGGGAGQCDNRTRGRHDRHIRQQLAAVHRYVGSAAEHDGDLLTGKIGWWGPFRSGVEPSNKIAGMPNGGYVGTPRFSEDGGGAFTSDPTGYVNIPDGGAGGTYDWTSGAWSAQVDFAFPVTPTFPGGPFLLVSKGSFARGVGWEIQINDTMFQGKYQIQTVSNHGLDSYHLTSSYLVAPGAFNRALFVCDATGVGIWHVNGTAGAPQSCAPSASGATDLVVGRYSDQPAYAAGFPIARVQIWNRALTLSEAKASTTTDPVVHEVPPPPTVGTFALSGAISPASDAGVTVNLGGTATRCCDRRRIRKLQL